jgi:chloramphenicol 3-O-phosphotransferase
MAASMDSDAAVAVLFLIGAPGAGKTSVLEALTTLLEIDGLEYGSLESETLSQGSPLLPASEWAPQLQAVVALQRGAGRKLFLITATPETADDLRLLIDATGAERMLVVCLSAPAETVSARVAGREPDRWPGKQRLIAHARQLAHTIPELDGIDLILDTTARRPDDLACDIRDAMKATGLLGPRPDRT